RTNVMGTFNLLECALEYWRGLPPGEKRAFRFLQVSTDEVYGSLGPGAPPSTEDSPYAPNSPYAASKAAGDHLVRSYHATYGLPVLLTHSSNNYGPRQYPEKLIPLMILRAREGEALPVYGDGLNVRDWVYVDDNNEALLRVLEKGRPGRTYNIGAACRKTNLEVVAAVCRLMDELSPDSPGRPHAGLVAHVADRPGHDRRYALDPTRLRTELGWSPRETFESGLRRTVAWYLAHQDWVDAVRGREYRHWMVLNYQDRGKPAVRRGA
ncbi:MAG: GDP-mannose 4,6-dehydratase, partial [Thermodesulfobacteriota bacterium]